ncbi:MAG: XRE family transcriptional regulator [Magnetococcus sp. DMHC-6]
MIQNLVGTRIRAVREQRKLTQQQLADQAGIPRATLATVERDDSNPSLIVVFKVARALDMTIDQLVESNRKRILHLPCREMRTTISGDGAYRAVTVTPTSAYHITQIVFQLDPVGVYDGIPHSPGSEEYIHVLEGTIELDVAGEQIRLQNGETAIFHGNVRHRYHNPSTEIRAVAVVTILEGDAYF